MTSEESLVRLKYVPNLIEVFDVNYYCGVTGCQSED